MDSRKIEAPIAYYSISGFGETGKENGSDFSSLRYVERRVVKKKMEATIVYRNISGVQRGAF